MGYASHLLVRYHAAALTPPVKYVLLVISIWSSKSQMSCKVAELTLGDDPRLCFCRRDAASLALTLYYAQLVGNMLWTPLFFTLKQVSLTRDG